MDVSVDDVESLMSQFMTQGRIGHAELEDLRLGAGSQGVQRGGDGDTTLEAVVDDPPLMGVGESTGLDEGGDATAPRVGLNPVEAAFGNESLEVFET